MALIYKYINFPIFNEGDREMRTYTFFIFQFRQIRRRITWYSDLAKRRRKKQVHCYKIYIQLHIYIYEILKIRYNSLTLRSQLKILKIESQVRWEFLSKFAFRFISHHFLLTSFKSNAVVLSLKEQTWWRRQRIMIYWAFTSTHLPPKLKRPTISR